LNRIPSYKDGEFITTSSVVSETEGVPRELGRQLAKHLAGVPQEVAIGRGETWSALSSFIEKNNVDPVVMSTHGRTGLGKALTSYMHRTASLTTD
jgi:nucleotide-binding universal stress UspA family protein